MMVYLMLLSVSMMKREFINLQIPFEFCLFGKNTEKMLLVCGGMMRKPCLKNISDTDSENVWRKQQ